VSGLKEVGIFSVACVLPTVRPTPGEITVQTRMFGPWSRDLKRQGLKLRLDNVVDPLMLSAALEAGVDFCSGERLWPAVQAAEGMKPYSREHFLRALPATAQERHSA
jgi:hypothetical protein